MRHPAHLLIALAGLGIGAWQPVALAAPPLGREPAAGVPQEPAAGVRTKSSSKPPKEKTTVNLSIGGARAPADTVAPTRETEDRVQSPTTASVRQELVPGEDRSAQRRQRDRGSRRFVELVPRQFGMALGWSNIAIDNLPDALIADPRPHPNGVATFAHVLWQIAGLSRRWPTWLGPQLSLDVFPASPVSRRVIALGYGFQIKHHFGRHPRVRPFLSYGIGAVQTWVKTIPGREVGHQTRVELGVAFPVSQATSLTVSSLYRHQGLATFFWDDAGTLSYSFHTFGALVGIIFDARARRSRGRNEGRKRGQNAGRKRGK